MIETIVPAGVAVAEAFADAPNLPLFPSEQAEIAKATEKRRREFTTVRHCARLALLQLGRSPAPILPGPGRAPQWPAGVVGSLTHCDGYRAAAAAPDNRFAMIGIDAEPHRPLPPGVLAVIARDEETRRLAELAEEFPGTQWDTLAFSAKEAVYKAWFPSTRGPIDFKDVALTFDPVVGSFTAHRRPADLAGTSPPLTGRWLVDNGLILTVATHGA